MNKGMKKINVLNVIGALNTGGTETMLVNILRALDKDKFKVYFLCYSNDKYDYEDEITELGGTIIRIKPLQKVGVVRFIREIKKNIELLGS